MSFRSVYSWKAASIADTCVSAYGVRWVVVNLWRNLLESTTRKFFLPRSTCPIPASRRPVIVSCRVTKSRQYVCRAIWDAYLVADYRQQVPVLERCRHAGRTKGKSRSDVIGVSASQTLGLWRGACRARLIVCVSREQILISPCPRTS